MPVTIFHPTYLVGNVRVNCIKRTEIDKKIIQQIPIYAQRTDDDGDKNSREVNVQLAATAPVHLEQYQHTNN